ncbi:hypothetical protein HYW20_08190 [Candidatus Woesearchaeota archaeon]|nr:hypothetical protein [Candidatus Woesearchaeota archaeon]
MPLLKNGSLKIRKNLVYFALFILLGSIFSYFYIKPFLAFRDTPLLRLDWHQQFQVTGAIWITLTKYHEFPFWNPYVHGGNFLFGHPLSHVLSPQTLIVLLFGPIRGIYYSVLFFYTLSFAGCYLLGRHFKLSFPATMYLAIVFTFQSHVMNYLFIGSTLWMNAAYLPFSFYFLLRALENWKYGVLAGFFHALIYLGGSVYIFMLYILFVLIFAASNMIAKGNLKAIKAILIMFLFSFLFASIKIFPNIDLYNINSRDVGFQELPLKLEILKKTFLDKNQAWDIVSVYWIGDFNFHFPHFGDYIGIIPILLALAGLMWLRDLEMILATLATFLMYLSNFSAFSFIWKAVHAIPPFSSLQHPARFIIFLGLMISIAGAKVISKLNRAKTSSKWLDYLRNLLIIALILFVFIDLTKSSYIILSNFKPLPMQKDLIKWDGNFEYYDFYQRFNLTEQQVANLDANYFKSFEQIDTLSNKGVNKRGLDPMTINRGPIMSKGDYGYRGEYYFVDTNGSFVQLEKWSPNKISLKAKTENDNILVVNQNFHNQWKTKENFEIINYNGLLGIKIPKGEHQLHIYVFQNKIFIGAFLFLVGVVLGFYLLLTK